ncbi:MAG TPA: homoserine O-succinyltransferase [Acidimicrobiales bacterium]|jgi:homoserine O-succinyltransferase|nr:homoserine O-succinyltransferase [Acidimicrobiales bacterium]
MTPAAERSGGCVLVNLMPDAAFVASEQQWLRLIQATPGRRRLMTIPDERRSTETQDHIDRHYLTPSGVVGTRADMVIVTGSEPEVADVRDERSWSGMVEIFDWAVAHSRSLILSCQAAHAFLAHVDGLSRRRLGAKCSGVFDQHVSTDHRLARGLGDVVSLPHSRLNDVATIEVARHGWDVLVASDAGWGVITRRLGSCRVVAVQGHFEYEADSLLREYRRDVGRYVRGERPDFPAVPTGYFDPAQSRVIESVRADALAGRRVDVDLLSSRAMRSRLRAPWQSRGARILSNVIEETQTAETVLPSC